MQTNTPFTGKDLIARGYRPAPWFSEALDHVNARALTGEALDTYLQQFKAPDPLPLHTAPVNYRLNIAADGAEEAGNVAKVQQTMDLVMRTPTVTAGSVMPDACPAGPPGTIPVGGVVVAENAIHPGMHSADICCSVMCTDLGDADPKLVLDAAQAVTHFGPGGRERDAQYRIPAEIATAFADNRFLNNKRSIRLMREQLGTQGDGNHFLYVGRSAATGHTLLVTHHGSRGPGALLYNHGMKLAERYRQHLSPDTPKQNAWIPFDTEDGRDYWAALQIIRSWTKVNHEVIHDATARGVGYAVQDRFWNEHNFVFRDGTRFYHAKGATPLVDAFVPDGNGLRLVPLNMAEPILVVRGEATPANLGFAPHGAGRNHSRSAHRRAQTATDEQVFRRETQGLDVRFYSGHIDTTELPSAYKDAATVRRQMTAFGLGEVVDEIRPYGCIMAGDWQKDAPWRKRKRRR